MLREPPPVVEKQRVILDVFARRGVRACGGAGHGLAVERLFAHLNTAWYLAAIAGNDGEILIAR